MRFVPGFFVPALLCSLLAAGAATAAPAGADDSDDSVASLTETMRLQLADALPAEELVPEHEVPCVGGMSGAYPCDNVDLLELVPLSGMGGAADANDIWGWTAPERPRVRAHRTREPAPASSRSPIPRTPSTSVACRAPATVAPSGATSRPTSTTPTSSPTRTASRHAGLRSRSTAQRRLAAGDILRDGALRPDSAARTTSSSTRRPATPTSSAARALAAARPAPAVCTW